MSYEENFIQKPFKKVRCSIGQAKKKLYKLAPPATILATLQLKSNLVLILFESRSPFEKNNNNKNYDFRKKRKTKGGLV